MSKLIEQYKSKGINMGMIFDITSYNTGFDFIDSLYTDKENKCILEGSINMVIGESEIDTTALALQMAGNIVRPNKGVIYHDIISKVDRDRIMRLIDISDDRYPSSYFPTLSYKIKLEDVFNTLLNIYNVKICYKDRFTYRAEGRNGDVINKFIPSIYIIDESDLEDYKDVKFYGETLRAIIPKLKEANIILFITRNMENVSVFDDTISLEDRVNIKNEIAPHIPIYFSSFILTLKDINKDNLYECQIVKPVDEKVQTKYILNYNKNLGFNRP